MNAGGAETFLMKIYRELDRTQFQMDFCVNSNKNKYAEEIASLGGKIYTAPSKSKSPLKAFLAVKNIVKENKYEYVMRVNEHSLSVIDLLAAKCGGAKHLIMRSSNSNSPSTLILNTVVCIVLIKRGASIHIVKLTTSLIYVIRPLYLSFYVKQQYCLDRKIKYDKEPIKQKWNGVAQHVAAVVLDGTDNIVLTIFAGLKIVSIYSVYNIVVAGVKQLFLAMTNGVQSLIGELWAKQELDELKRFFGWVEWSIHTGTTFVFGVTSILIVPFVQIYTYGINDVNYVQPLFAILIVAANAGHCLRLPYNIMILAGGHYRQTQKNYIVAATVNIIVSVLAVKTLGLVGVAIGTLLAMFYQTVWMAIYDSKNLICWPIKNFIKQMVVDVISVLAFSLLATVFKFNTITWLAWVEYAIVISISALIIQVVINTLFYKKYMVQLASKLRRVFVKRKV